MQNPLVSKLNEDRDAIVQTGLFSELHPNLTVSNSGPSQALLDANNLVIVKTEPDAIDADTQELSVTAPTLSATGENAVAVNYAVTSLPTETKKTKQRDRIINTIKSTWSDKFAVEGFNYGGNHYQIDPASQQLMTAVKTQLADGVTDPHGGRWRTTSNTWITMDDTDVATFIDAVAVYVKAVRTRAWDLIDQASVATTLAGLDSIEADIANGWPAN